MNLQNYSIPSSNEVELNEYEPMPVDWYPVQVESEETKQTLSGGTMLNYKLRIFGDKYKGRTVYAAFNIICPTSDAAEKIGRKQIAQFGKACHLANLVDSSELVGKTCKAHVIQEEYNGQIKNKVNGFDYLTDDVAAPEMPKTTGKAWYEK